ncbi:class I SAM-dependent methyltransferase [Sphingobacterium paludis]|uniref:Methyltransferase family protein n=1 Tax=Sphingobacterium paludis TaxID=1476465 RepID=A0A4R7D8U3_9SPHI|nr:SAM-dependent methyltransferase [Sphingobacterium paludis]TDS16234.1 methyltransferase family protein [Sphingobacterium paludis]
MDNHTAFITQLSEAIKNGDFVKLSLGHYKGEEKALKNIYVKLVIIKRLFMLSFTYRYQTKDITRNYAVADGVAEIERLMGKDNFRAATLFTTSVHVFAQLSNRGEWLIRQEKSTIKKEASRSHDEPKARKLQADSKRYLQELRLTDAEGKVFKNMQDKWKQINHYIEILSSMLQALPENEMLRVVDMGAGKGYLTFALYDYLRNVLQRDVIITGVEYRGDLVEFCNQVAQRSEFAGLSFAEGTIESYTPESGLNVLIALHACDTATDDAIAKGIRNNADLIVVAPCCHKQIRREIEKGKTKNELDFLLKHGIFLERQAEMLTDGLRALLMEYHGYQTKVFEFVSDAHTPKNVLVVGVKKDINTARQAEIRLKIEETKRYFGVSYHHLERLLG